MTEPTLETLTRRLERLERQNRVLKIAAILTLCVLAAIGVIGQAAPKGTPLEVSAQRFILRDSEGHVRAILGGVWGESAAPPENELKIPFIDPFIEHSGGKNVGLHIYDQDGQLRAGIFSGSTSGKVVVRDKATASDAGIFVGSGAAHLTLSATNISPKAAEMAANKFVDALNAAKTEAERKKALDADMVRGALDYTTASLVTWAKQESKGSLSGQESAAALHVGNARVATQAGKPSVMLFDEKGATRAVLGQIEVQRVASGATEILPPSSLVLFDKDGKVIWRVPSSGGNR